MPANTTGSKGEDRQIERERESVCGGRRVATSLYASESHPRGTVAFLGLARLQLCIRFLLVSVLVVGVLSPCPDIWYLGTLHVYVCVRVCAYV